jgi:hypothetical protein
LAALINVTMASKEDIKTLRTEMQAGFERIENLLLAEQKRKIEDLEKRMKRLEDALAVYQTSRLSNQPLRRAASDWRFFPISMRPLRHPPHPSLPLFTHDCPARHSFSMLRFGTIHRLTHSPHGSSLYAHITISMPLSET